MKLPSKKQKRYKPPDIDFFNSFIVTNWRLCVSKLLVTGKKFQHQLEFQHFIDRKFFIINKNNR